MNATIAAPASRTLQPRDGEVWLRLFIIEFESVWGGSNERPVSRGPPAARRAVCQIPRGNLAGLPNGPKPATIDRVGPPPPPSDPDVTRLLAAHLNGEEDARNELIKKTYNELRRIADAQARHPAATLQPTALVNEAYLQLFGSTDLHPEHRGQFFALAAKVMRDLIVDHLRARKAQRRGGHRHQVTLDSDISPQPGQAIDALDLCNALEELRELDRDQHEIVELRFFTGLEMTEIAAVTNRSRSTVQREWRAARAWLAVRLRDYDS